MERERIDLRFVCEPEDLLTWERFRRDYRSDGTRRSRVKQWWLQALLGFFALAFTVRIFVPPPPRPGQTTDAARLTCAIYAAAFSFFLFLSLYRRLFLGWIYRRAFARAKEDSGLRQDLCVTLLPETMTTSGFTSSLSYGWDRIHSVAEFPDQLLLNHNERFTTIVPRHATVDAAEWDEVQQFVRRYFRGPWLDFTGGLLQVRGTNAPVDAEALPVAGSYEAHDPVNASRVEFLPAAEDLVAVREYQREHQENGEPFSRLHRWGLATVTSVVCIVVIIGFFELLQQKPPAPWFNKAILGVMALASMAFLLRVPLENLTIRRRFRKLTANSPQRQIVRAVISPEWLTYGTSNTTESHTWDVFRRVVIRPDGILFVIASARCFLIPRRAFVDPQDWKHAVSRFSDIPTTK